MPVEERKIAKCPIEILEMLNRGVPLRLSEISKVTGSKREVLEKIEKRAMAKVREAFAGFDLLDMNPERPRAAKRRRIRKG